MYERIRVFFIVLGILLSSSVSSPETAAMIESLSLSGSTTRLSRASGDWNYKTTGYLVRGSLSLFQRKKHNLFGRLSYRMIENRNTTLVGDVEYANQMGYGVGLAYQYSFFTFGADYCGGIAGKNFYTTTGTSSKEVGYNYPRIEYNVGLMWFFGRLGLSVSYNVASGKPLLADYGDTSPSSYSESTLGIGLAYAFGGKTGAFLKEAFTDGPK